MTTSVPVDMLDLFEEPALGEVSHTTDAGQIVPFPMWVDYDGSHLLTSSPVGSKKGRASVRSHGSNGQSAASHVTTAIIPPGRRTRRASRSAALRPRTWWKANEETTASALPSASGRRSAVPVRQSRRRTSDDARVRAASRSPTASIPGAGSTAVPGSTASARPRRGRGSPCPGAHVDDVGSRAADDGRRNEIE